MRFAAFLSLGFGTNIAIASVCKPRSRTSSDPSSVSTESVSTISTDIALTTTTYVELSITLTSTGDDKTSTEVTESGSATAEISASTAIETTKTAISTATAETTVTAEATTSADATTTTEDTFVPIPTFNIKALGSDVDGQLLRGDPVTYNSIGWFTPSPPILTFTIEASNNYVREINTGKYLCVSFGGDGFPNSNTLCTPGQMAGIEPLTCEQNRDRKLKCSAPAGECHLDEMTDSTACYAVPGTWDKFYRIRGRIINTPALVMTSSGSPPWAEFEAIELKLAPYVD
ncbi:uncharacterized protein FIESC28_01153 [Fusarium coffeatum]|uniref:Ig-like domain-containing protein n=1 Tax=Fusarium coffeatum TaxID=231269 RepID=A0A366SBY2_9HYPO|nr:uncharacterized protein FIESC28_01153 [Fusarium coffeatum]RBR26125.1 hypothetical protein FIESC28_01153 [Fusarium coffeatum]